MAEESTSGGRLTLPIQTGMDKEIRALIERLRPDAVRNSDGTELPALVHELATKVYSTYFVGRGDNAWAREHPSHLTRIHLLSDRVTALRDGTLSIHLMEQWFADQVKPDTDCDLAKHWQVIDRTTGETIPPSSWRLVGEDVVEIDDARAGHVYTVGFLAVQLWDPTQMYNYLTNGWESDPSREKEMPFDVRHAETWDHVREGLETWLGDHPEIDVVRFTTFFYHFTLVYGQDAKERFVDWFGYGGYLSLALEHPEFVDRMEEIVAEFRAIHDQSAGEKPETEPFTVAVLNCWGSLRTWQTHMVAHALHYRQAYTYLGVIEALAGLPFDVEFLSFDDIRDGVPERVGVIINAGAIGTAFSGGPAWADPVVTSAVNRFVADGGGLIGVGDPAAHPMGGRTFQLADALGVDRELGWGLSTNRRLEPVEEHFITADLDAFDAGEGTPDIVPVGNDVEVLRAGDGVVQIAANECGEGRCVYFSGLPYSHDNARLLHRALVWAAGREAEWGNWVVDDPRIEVGRYPGQRKTLLINNVLETVSTSVRRPDGTPLEVTLPPGGHRWFTDDELGLKE